MRGWIGLVGLAAGLGMAMPACAQEKTPAVAFAFIVQNATDGSWQGDVQYCDNNGCADDGSRAVTSVAYEGGTYCVIRLTMRGDTGPVYRTLNLATAIEIYPGRGINGVLFEGPIRMGNGQMLSQWWLRGPSQAIGDRVAAAFSYLHELCAPKSAF